MEIPLRLLIIEDSDRDVALEVRALEAAGYRVTYAVVDTAAKMKAALAGQAFDIVISDHNMPQFDAPRALAVLKQSGQDIPFIIVSGTIGEEMAVALIKAGAHDYVLKDRLSRLASAVENAMREAEGRRGRKQAEEDLSEKTRFTNNLINSIGDPIFVKDASFRFILANDALCKMLGMEREKIIGKTLGESLPEDQMKHFLEIDAMVLESGQENLCEEPLTGNDGNILTIVTRKTRYVDEKGSRFLVGVIRDITERKLSELKLEKSYESLKKTLDDAIKAMVKIVETRDPYTAGHQQRVADLATAIAKEMKLEDTIIDQLRTAAVIHDIGKMYVPSEILSKPGKLSDTEFGLIKTHSQGGYDIVKGIDLPAVVAQSILQHHERLDGSGYPNGLNGEEICLAAKILSVSDVVEAMSSHRPYRASLGIGKALEEISKNRGKLYDPDVVDTCLGLFNSGKFEFKAG